MYKSPCPLLAAISNVRTPNTTLLPSGDKRGSDTRPIFHNASGVSTSCAREILDKQTSIPNNLIVFIIR